MTSLKKITSCKTCVDHFLIWQLTMAFSFQAVEFESFKEGAML